MHFQRYRYVFILALCCFAAVTATANDLAPERILLTLCDAPSTTMAVTWRTQAEDPDAAAQLAPVVLPMDNPEQRQLDFELYATVHKATNQEVILSRRDGGHYHTVVFTNLTPGTTYLYRVGSGRIWSEWNQFKTTPATPKAFSFIYMGDVQTDILNSWAHVMRAALRKATDAGFILFGGDLVDEGHMDRLWQEWFDAAGWIFRTMPVLATPGNHEFTGRRDQERRLTPLWKPQFAFPENGPEGLKEITWFLDYQDVRLISLNSIQNLDEQVNWLQHVLKDNPNRWTIVTFHYPIYSSGADRDYAQMREALLPLFEQYQVDLVLMGHDHTYGRTGRLAGGKEVPDGQWGVVYVNSVSGQKQYGFNSRFEPLFKRTAESTQLYQVIDINSKRLLFNAYTPNGACYDSFELQKDAEGKVAYIENKPATADRRWPKPPIE